jgi:photosystem II stability/assembly factor-like uncharacterized protein
MIQNRPFIFKAGLLLFLWTMFLGTILLLLFEGMAHSEEMPIWKYDFRDTFYDIAYIDQEKAVIVGAGGRILVTHKKYPNLWSPRRSGTKEMLTCLSFVDNGHGWAAGHGGVIVYTDNGGNTWVVQRPPSDKNLPIFDIHFVSRKVGYACGAYDTLLKTTDGGRTWVDSPTGLDNIYNGLFFLDEKRGYLVGEFGTILRTSDGGGSWERIDLGAYQGTFFGITVVPPETLLVFGITGKIMRSADGGSSWDIIESGTANNLFRGAASGDDIVIAGKNGTLMHSRDGGERFVNRADENDLTVYAGICANPAGGFVCVGERGTIKQIGPFTNK